MRTVLGVGSLACVPLVCGGPPAHVLGVMRLGYAGPRAWCEQEQVGGGDGAAPEPGGGCPAGLSHPLCASHACAHAHAQALALEAASVLCSSWLLGGSVPPPRAFGSPSLSPRGSLVMQPMLMPPTGVHTPPQHGEHARAYTHAQPPSAPLSQPGSAAQLHVLHPLSLHRLHEQLDHPEPLHHSEPLFPQPQPPHQHAQLQQHAPPPHAPISQRHSALDPLTPNGAAITTAQHSAAAEAAARAAAQTRARASGSHASRAGGPGSGAYVGAAALGAGGKAALSGAARTHQPPAGALHMASWAQQQQQQRQQWGRGLRQREEEWLQQLRQQVHDQWSLLVQQRQQLQQCQRQQQQQPGHNLLLRSMSDPIKHTHDSSSGGHNAWGPRGTPDLPPAPPSRTPLLSPFSQHLSPAPQGTWQARQQGAWFGSQEGLALEQQQQQQRAHVQQGHWAGHPQGGGAPAKQPGGGGVAEWLLEAWTAGGAAGGAGAWAPHPPSIPPSPFEKSPCLTTPLSVRTSPSDPHSSPQAAENSRHLALMHGTGAAGSPRTHTGMNGMHRGYGMSGVHGGYGMSALHGGHGMSRLQGSQGMSGVHGGQGMSGPYGGHGWGAPGHEAGGGGWGSGGHLGHRASGSAQYWADEGWPMWPSAVAAPWRSSAPATPFMHEQHAPTPVQLRAGGAPLWAGTRSSGGALGPAGGAGEALEWLEGGRGGEGGRPGPATGTPQLSQGSGREAKGPSDIQMVGLIGRGGFGTVYRAVWRGMEVRAWGGEKRGGRERGARVCCKG